MSQKNIQKRTGNALVKADSFVSGAQIKEAQELCAMQGGSLGGALVKLGHIKGHKVAGFLAEKYNLPYVNLGIFHIPRKVASLVPQVFCEENFVVPVQCSGAYLAVAIENPTRMQFLQKNLSSKTGLKVCLVIASEKDIRSSIVRAYAYKHTEKVESVLKKFNKRADAEDAEIADEDKEDESKSFNLREKVSDPLIEFVNLVLAESISSGVSDIHIEIYEKRTRIRCRKDGVLIEKNELSDRMSAALINRVKIMSSMDISERRKPQDGRIKVYDDLTNVEVDLRVSSVPTVFGEKIVMRLLDKSNLKVDIAALGMEEFQVVMLKRALQLSQGMLLLTGPTGSGKSTTIYSALEELNTVDRNIMTAEDPVEYNIEGLNQVQVNPAVGFHFPNALRAFLRQDPEVIMVGEVRDEETASICFKASSTGHLVVSTLHTNDAVGTVTRLVAMGQPPYIVAENLSIVIAQRLVKKVCEKCKIPVKISKDELIRMGVDPDKAKDYTELAEGTGCQQCSGTGLSGREAVFEVLEIDAPFRDAILANKTGLELKRLAMDKGFKTLRQHALLKLQQGRISAAEVLHATVADDVEAVDEKDEKRSA